MLFNIDNCYMQNCGHPKYQMNVQIIPFIAKGIQTKEFQKSSNCVNVKRVYIKTKLTD